MLLYGHCAIIGHGLLVVVMVGYVLILSDSVILSSQPLDNDDKGRVHWDLFVFSFARNKMLNIKFGHRYGLAGLSYKNKNNV